MRVRKVQIKWWMRCHQYWFLKVRLCELFSLKVSPKGHRFKLQTSRSFFFSFILLNISITISSFLKCSFPLLKILLAHCIMCVLWMFLLIVPSWLFFHHLVFFCTSLGLVLFLCDVVSKQSQLLLWVQLFFIRRQYPKLSLSLTVLRACLFGYQ